MTLSKTCSICTNGPNKQNISEIHYCRKSDKKDLQIKGVVVNGNCIFSELNYNKENYRLQSTYKADDDLQVLVVCNNSGIERKHLTIDDLTSNGITQDFEFNYDTPPFDGIKSEYYESIYSNIELYDYTGYISSIHSRYDSNDSLPLRDCYFPNVTVINKNGLAQHKLNSVNNLQFPKLTCINDNGFISEYNNTDINRYVHLDNVKLIGKTAFYDYWLSSITLPSLLSVGESAFDWCGYGLIYLFHGETKHFFINIPNVKQIKSKAFKLFGYNIYERAGDTNRVIVHINLSNTEILPEKFNLSDIGLYNSMAYPDRDIILYVKDEDYDEWREHQTCNIIKASEGLITVKVYTDLYSQYNTDIDKKTDVIKGLLPDQENKNLFIGQFIKGQDVILDVVAPKNYYFSKWSNNKTTTRIQFTAKSDVQLTAYFNGYTILEQEAWTKSLNFKYDVEGPLTTESKDIYGYAWPRDIKKIHSLENSKITSLEFDNSQTKEITSLKLYNKNIDKIESSQFQYSELYEVNTPYIHTIQDHAFEECMNLSSVYAIELTDTYTIINRIWDYAFKNCINLLSVNCPGVREIGNYTFQNCRNLEYVNIPIVDTIGINSFENCYPLGTLKLPFLEHVSMECFRRSGLNAIYLSSNLKTIDYHAFEDCKDLSVIDLFYCDRFSIQNEESNREDWAVPEYTEIIYKDSPLIYESIVTRINNKLIYIFTDSLSGGVYPCHGGNEISNNSEFEILSSSISCKCTSIAKDEFRIGYDYKLQWIDAYGILSVGEDAFSQCDNLTFVNLYDATDIDHGAFSNCFGLISVNLPEVINLSGFVFGNCPKLSSVNLPKVENIGYAAFDGCDNITSIDLPKVKNIERDVFYGCGKLSSINISSVLNIENEAFSTCGLTSITLPKVKNIGENAFLWCNYLQFIDLRLNPNFTKNKDSEYRNKWGIVEPIDIIYIDT